MKLYIKIYDVYKEIDIFNSTEDIIKWLEKFYNISFEDKQSNHFMLDKHYDENDFFNELGVKII